MKIKLLWMLIFVCGCLLACNESIKCERHFLPKGFIGKVTIYFDQKKGQKEVDENGCIIYRVDKNGNCYTSFKYKQGSAFPNETYKFYETIRGDSVNRIFEFYEKEYKRDSVNNKLKKYIFFHSSGYTYPNYTFEYYVDYGENYRNHLFY